MMGSEKRDHFAVNLSGGGVMHCICPPAAGDPTGGCGAMGCWPGTEGTNAG